MLTLNYFSKIFLEADSVNKTFGEQRSPYSAFIRNKAKILTQAVTIYHLALIERSVIPSTSPSTSLYIPIKISTCRGGKLQGLLAFASTVR